MQQNSQNRPKNRVLFIREGAAAWKKFITTGCGGCDKYQLLQSPGISVTISYYIASHHSTSMHLWRGGHPQVLPCFFSALSVCVSRSSKHYRKMQQLNGTYHSLQEDIVCLSLLNISTGMHSVQTQLKESIVLKFISLLDNFKLKRKKVLFSS